MAGDHPSGMWSSAILYYFQVLFFGISDNCLLTVRTDRYNLDRNFQHFFQERDVSIELFGKFVFTLHFRHIDIPTPVSYTHLDVYKRQALNLWIVYDIHDRPQTSFLAVRYKEV